MLISSSCPIFKNYKLILKDPFGSLLPTDTVFIDRIDVNLIVWI